MASMLDLLRRLAEHGVDFVLVGGMAAAAHGSSVVTEDVDICLRFDSVSFAWRQKWYLKSRYHIVL